MDGDVVRSGKVGLGLPEHSDYLHIIPVIMECQQCCTCILKKKKSEQK